MRAVQSVHRDAPEEEDYDNAFRYLQIRRVMLTPTRVAAYPGKSSLYNRALQNFKQYREHFICESFADEDGQPIPFQRLDDLFIIVLRWLATGFETAGEESVFLSYSSSQLREGGA